MNAYSGALRAGDGRLHEATAVQAVLSHSFARERPRVRFLHDQYATCKDTREITTGKSLRSKEM
jgi:hypothetical protein